MRLEDDGVGFPDARTALVVVMKLEERTRQANHCLPGLPMPADHLLLEWPKPLLGAITSSIVAWFVSEQGEELRVRLLTLAEV